MEQENRMMSPDATISKENVEVTLSLKCLPVQTAQMRKKPLRARWRPIKLVGYGKTTDFDKYVRYVIMPKEVK